MYKNLSNQLNCSMVIESNKNALNDVVDELKEKIRNIDISDKEEEYDVVSLNDGDVKSINDVEGDIELLKKDVSCLHARGNIVDMKIDKIDKVVDSVCVAVRSLTDESEGNRDDIKVLNKKIEMLMEENKRLNMQVEIGNIKKDLDNLERRLEDVEDGKKKKRKTDGIVYFEDKGIYDIINYYLIVNDPNIDNRCRENYWGRRVNC